MFGIWKIQFYQIHSEFSEKCLHIGTNYSVISFGDSLWGPFVRISVLKDHLFIFSRIVKIDTDGLLASQGIFFLITNNYCALIDCEESLAEHLFRKVLERLFWEIFKEMFIKNLIFKDHGPTFPFKMFLFDSKIFKQDFNYKLYFYSKKIWIRGRWLWGNIYLETLPKNEFFFLNMSSDKGRSLNLQRLSRRTFDFLKIYFCGRWLRGNIYFETLTRNQFFWNMSSDRGRWKYFLQGSLNFTKSSLIWNIEGSISYQNLDAKDQFLF